MNTNKPSIKPLNWKHVLSAVIACTVVASIGMMQAYDKGKESGIEQTTNSEISQVDCTVKPCLIFFIEQNDSSGTVRNYKDLLK